MSATKIKTRFGILTQPRFPKPRPIKHPQHHTLTFTSRENIVQMWDDARGWVDLWHGSKSDLNQELLSRSPHSKCYRLISRTKVEKLLGKIGRIV